MKTNHKRGFKGKDDGAGLMDPSKSKHYYSKISGKSAFFGAGRDAACGKHGLSRQKAGAKKFVRTRERIANKQIARNALRDHQ